MAIDVTHTEEWVYTGRRRYLATGSSKPALYYIWRQLVPAEDGDGHTLGEEKLYKKQVGQGRVMGLGGVYTMSFGVRKSDGARIWAAPPAFVRTYEDEEQRLRWEVEARAAETVGRSEERILAKLKNAEQLDDLLDEMAAVYGRLSPTDQATWVGYVVRRMTAGYLTERLAAKVKRAEEKAHAKGYQRALKDAKRKRR